MAVLCGIWGKKEPEYVGCVLNVYERNGYDDSDFFATCWDEEKHAVVDVMYDTTRCGGGGYARIDATQETRFVTSRRMIVYTFSIPVTAWESYLLAYLIQSASRDGR